MAGYTRQAAADIQQGLDINAPPLNAEFNTLRDAFDATLGHAHDGTVGNGPPLDLGTATKGILALGKGGTGGNTPAQARTNLSLVPGTDILAYSAVLQSIAGLTTSANQILYTTSSNVYSTTALTPFVRTILDDADASTVLSTLGVSTFIKTLLDDADVSTAQSTLGISTFVKTILDDADAAAVRTTIDVFSKTETNSAISSGVSSGLATKVSKAGDRMTGSLSSTPKTHGTLSTGTETFNYTDSNLHSATIAGNVTINPTNLTEGDVMQINIAYTSGTIAVSGTTYWELGTGLKSTNIADLGITLTSGQPYRMIFEMVAGLRTGIFT